MAPFSTAQRRKRTWTLLIATTILSMGGMGVGGVALIERFNQTDKYRKQNQATWHAVVCAIEEKVQADPFSTPAAVNKQLRFFDDLLIHDVHTKGCGLL